MAASRSRSLLRILRPALLALVALPLALTAAQAQTLRVVPQADLKNLDPIWTTAYVTRNHAYLIYDVLFAMNSDFEPQPQMVGSWEVSDDRLTYTFTLRDGLTWHDGAPVRAADVVASLKRFNVKDTMGQRLADVTEELRAVNDRTFELELTRPYGLVLETLSKITSYVPFMMPERMAQTDPYEQVSEHVGSGPFRFIEEDWMPGQRVVYEKFEDYVPRNEPPDMAAGGKVVKVDRVEWRYIPDPATAGSALQTGEVDYFEVPPTDLVPLFEADPDIVVRVTDPLGTVGNLRPNSLHPPFNDPRARQALLWMVDQEEYLRAIIGNQEYWQVCGAYFVCGTPYASEANAEALLNKDLDKARQLLDAAGYDGEPIVLMDPTDFPVLHAATLVTAQNLRELGVNVDLQAMDWSTLTSRRAEKKAPEDGGWHLFHTYTNAAGAFSPVTNNQVNTACDQAWFGWPCDERITDRIDAFANSTDPAEQQRLAREIQELALEIVPYVQYGQWFPPVAYRSNLSGVIDSPVPFFWNIEKN